MMGLYGYATDRFFIKDFAIAPGITRTISIELNNETEYTAFQCDLYLPEGLSVDENSFALTERKHSNHTLTVNEFPDGSYRLMSYSIKLKTYSGNEGPLVTFDVTTNSDFHVPCQILLKNTLFTTPDGQEIAFAEELCTISLLGDVNSDGSVDITDATLLINFLLDNDASLINLIAADVNNDILVDITDATMLINYLLSGVWPVMS
ncbi:MAG: dockerin type I repeat-containing protein [Muribaculaceae bacterium]|nr:dockerin type I repeat-containing protein [Muribaculaceae bacterium]